jgi:hypothetical protein
LESIRRKRIKKRKKETNSLSARHAIGNIKINVMSRQKRSLRVNLLRLKSAYRNKLMSTRPMRTSP